MHPYPFRTTFLLKCHDVSLAQQFRFVYIYRNPEDALVSYFQFLKKRLIAFMEDGLEDFCREQLNVWLKHVDMALMNSSHGMIVSYENLTRETESCLERVCKFVGLNATYEQISVAVFNNTTDLQRKRYVGVGSKQLADYIMATARVGGNIQFLSTPLSKEILFNSKQQLLR